MAVHEQKLRIVIASEDRSASAAIGMLINAQEDLDFAGEVDDIADLMVKIKSKRMDLVVFDWDLLGKRMETLVDLLELFDEPPAIVALSVHEDARASAMASGAVGFASKSDPPSRLLETIRDSRQKNQRDINPNGIGA